MITNTFTTNREEIIDLIKQLNYSLEYYNGPITVECKHYEVTKGGGAVSFRREDGTALGIAQSQVVLDLEENLMTLARRAN